MTQAADIRGFHAQLYFDARERGVRARAGAALMRALGLLAALGFLSLDACLPKGAASPGGFALSKTGRVACGEWRDELRLWSLPDERMTRENDMVGRDVDTIVLSGDGSQVAVGDHAGGFAAWDTSTCAPRHESPGQAGGPELRGLRK